jgi:hypothetical protein
MGDVRPMARPPQCVSTRPRHDLRGGVYAETSVSFRAGVLKATAEPATQGVLDGVGVVVPGGRRPLGAVVVGVDGGGGGAVPTRTLFGIIL